MVFKKISVSKKIPKMKEIEEIEQAVEEEAIEEESEEAIEKAEEPAIEAVPVDQDDYNNWSVENRATQTEPVIYNKLSDKSYTLHEAVVEILNELDRFA